MGGCRCMFRDCTVSSASNPKMHFFHFPASHPQLLLEWVKITDKAFILDLPKSKIFNKKVCARHFRDECFMNYKKDRLLVGRAVPTLTRLTKSLAMDYENCDENGKPTLIKLAKPTMKHLIAPPEFPCPLELNDSDDDFEDIHLKRFKGEDFLQPSKRVRIEDLEIEICNAREARSSSLEVEEQLHATADAAEESEILENKDTTSLSDELYELLSCSEESAEEEIIKTSSNANSSFANAKADKTTIEMLNKLKEESTSTITSLNARVHELELDLGDALKKLICAEEQNAELTKSNQDLMKKAQRIEEERNNKCDEFLKLQEAHEQLQKKYAEQIQQVAAVSSSDSNKLTVAQPPTKAQLFNGIKKYLSSSMTALLRMEMFGSAERAWKPDERRAAVDLLQLSESVYKYFADEWRFRLPSVREARTWLNEAYREEEEDL